MVFNENFVVFFDLTEDKLLLSVKPQGYNDFNPVLTQELSCAATVKVQIIHLIFKMIMCSMYKDYTISLKHIYNKPNDRLDI